MWLYNPTYANITNIAASITSSAEQIEELRAYYKPTNLFKVNNPIVLLIPISNNSSHINNNLLIHNSMQNNISILSGAHTISSIYQSFNTYILYPNNIILSLYYCPYSHINTFLSPHNSSILYSKYLDTNHVNSSISPLSPVN